MISKKLPDEKEAKQEVVQGSIGKAIKKPELEKVAFDRESWQPITSTGKKVKNSEIKSIDEILDNGIRIMESEIIDCLLPNLELDILWIGQSKGKFGGGKKSIWRQTQKKTPEGNKPSFATVIVMGNRDGYVGMGFGKAKETVPAREKAIKKAKLNIIKIKRGCGSWACSCGLPHSIPFKVKGKCGSVETELIPAPRGTNLCVEKECKRILALAGIKDIYSRTFGHAGTKLNHVKACIDALKKLSETKIPEQYISKAGIIEGKH